MAPAVGIQVRSLQRDAVALPMLDPRGTASIQASPEPRSSAGLIDPSIFTSVVRGQQCEVDGIGHGREIASAH